jgi:hypothetical protein
VRSRSSQLRLVCQEPLNLCKSAIFPGMVEQSGATMRVHAFSSKCRKMAMRLFNHRSIFRGRNRGYVLAMEGNWSRA